MLTLPAELMNVIVAFAPLFSKPVFEHAKLLIAGAILAPGKRTVTAALRVMGRSQDNDFQTYHRVLNRAVWSALAASRILLGLLISVFAPTGPLVFGIDDTIERRRGARIAAKGIYRDPVRSSHSHFVKASGLRWPCCMLLTEVSWAGRVWALPFLTVLCPTPALFGLYSITALTAQALMKEKTEVVRRAAWYAKTQPTFSDAIAMIGRSLWSHCHFSTSGQHSDAIIIPRSLLERLTAAVCYAA